MSDERLTEDDVPMETRESTGVANNLQDRMDIPPMLLRDLLIISLFFSGAMVLALTDSIDKAMVYLYFAAILYFGDRFRRIPRRSGPDQPPPVDSRASVKAVAEALLFAAFLICLVFDAIDSPLQRLLPKAFYDALLAADRALGLVIKPTFHVIVLLGFAIVLFCEWRYWSSHALDPRRSPSP